MRRPKHIAQAFEFAFVAQAFNLAGQTTTDGARAQAEIDAQGAARAESASRAKTAASSWSHNATARLWKKSG